MPTKKSENKPPKPGVIYARYSSHAQKEESIEQQIEECLAFAASKNIHVIRTYADKHITGRTDRRPQFQRLMRDAEKGEFEVVLAYKSNRISRQMIHALLYEAKLENHGIKTLYVKEEFGDSPSGRFAKRTMMNINQFYSENMSEDIMRGLMDNAKGCKVNGSIAFGYKKGDDGRYAIDEPKAAAVREIFERVLAGDSFVSIMDSLNGRGIRTRYGNKFTKTSFEKILKNDIYIGTYRYNGITVENGVPPILKKEVFYAMQKHLTEKKKPHGRQRENGEYLLTGKLCCGLCGSYMTGISGTSRNGELHYYYSCSKKREDGETCEKKNVNRDWLEKLIVEMTQEFIGRDDVIEWIADCAIKFQNKMGKQSEIAALEDELAGINKELQNFVTAIGKGIFSDTTQEAMLKLESDKKEIESTLTVAKATNQPYQREEIVDFLHSLRDKSPTNSPSYRKELISSFVRGVILRDDNIEIHYFYQGKDRIMSTKFAEDEDSEPSDPDGSPVFAKLRCGGSWWI